MAKLAALAAALLLCSPAALAWGGLAHEAICKVPFRELDDTARQRRATAGDSRTSIWVSYTHRLNALGVA